MYSPEKFQIFGQEIQVKYTKNLLQQGAWGTYNHAKKLITIQTHNIDGTELDEDHMSQVFHHELMHCIFDHLGYEELSHNEQLVDQVANCLYQVEKTLE